MSKKHRTAPAMSFSRKRVPVPATLAPKWPGKTLDEGFIPFPKRLLRCMGHLFQGKHAVDDFRVIMSVVDFARPDLLRYPSISYLAFTAGMSPTKFTKRLLAMRDRGWLTVKGNDEHAEIHIDGLTQQIELLTENFALVDRDDEETPDDAPLS